MDLLELRASDFADEDYARLDSKRFVSFARMRASGMARGAALIAAFEFWRDTENFATIDLSQVDFWAALCDGNPFVVEERRKYLESQASALAGASEIASVYLEIAMNPRERGAARVAAAREYCVLRGLTHIDSNGNTTIGRDLTDFYKNADTLRDKLPKPPTVAQTGHQEPTKR